MKKKFLITGSIAAISIVVIVSIFLYIREDSGVDNETNLYESGAIIGTWQTGWVYDYSGTEFKSILVFYEDGTGIQKGELDDENLEITWEIVSLETALGMPFISEYNNFFEGDIEHFSMIARQHYGVSWGLDEGETMDTSGWAAGDYVLCKPRVFNNYDNTRHTIVPHPFVFIDRDTLLIMMPGGNATYWLTYKRSE